MTGGGFLPRRALGLGLVLSAALAAAPARAQEGIPGVATGVGNRFLQTQTPLTNGAGVLEALFTHRFAQAAKDSEGNGLLGLGGGSYVTLGLDYALVKNLSVQVSWSNASYDYEFALKGTLLRPTEKLPLAVGLRGGLNWITASYAEKQSGAFGQLLVAATIADRVTLSVAPAWVQRTPYHADVWNVPLVAQVRIGSSLAAIAEFVPKKNWSPETTYQWSFAVEKQVYHHRFLIWIGNALPTTMDQLIGGDFNGDVTDRNLHIGFNISRAFDLR